MSIVTISFFSSASVLGLTYARPPQNSFDAFMQGLGLALYNLMLWLGDLLRLLFGG